MGDVAEGSPGAAASPDPMLSDRWAARLRGFGPVGILAFIIIFAGNFLFLPLSAILVLLWVFASRTPWSAIGYVRPRSWIGGLLLGVIAGGTFKLVMKSLVMPLLGADPVNHAFHYLAGNRAEIPAFLYTVIIGAGFGEETLYRGYLLERLGKLFGRGTGGRTAAVLVSAVLFGSVHYPFQGLAGAEQATIVGAVFATVMLLTGSIWPLMCAHAAFDLTAYGLIYWGLETRVAHWFFR